MIYNKFKFGVKLTNGKILQGYDAGIALSEPWWPDKSWDENIPILTPLPAKYLATTSEWFNFPDTLPEPQDYPYRAKIGGRNVWLYWSGLNSAIKWQALGVTQWRIEGSILNPSYVDALVAQNEIKRQYLNAMKAVYPDARIILLGYAGKQGWVEPQLSPSEIDARFEAFMKTTILWTDKELIIKKMLAL